MTKNNIPRNKFNQGGKRPVLYKLQDTDERNGRRYRKTDILHTCIGVINIVKYPYYPKQSTDSIESL